MRTELWPTRPLFLWITLPCDEDIARMARALTSNATRQLLDHDDDLLACKPHIQNSLRISLNG
jgi:hypothetical protein